MYLTSRFACMCGGSHEKHPRFAAGDSCSDKLVNSPQRDSMNRVQARLDLTLLDLTGTGIPHQDVKGFEIHDSADSKVYRR